SIPVRNRLVGSAERSDGLCSSDRLGPVARVAAVADYSLRLGSRQKDSNFSVVDLDVVGAELDREIELVLAGADVVLPAVPGRGGDAAVESPCAGRAVEVEAVALEGVEAAVAVRERDVLVADADGSDGAGRDVLGACDGHELHGRDPSNRAYKRGTLPPWRRSCCVGSMSSSAASSRPCCRGITSCRRTAP